VKKHVAPLDQYAEIVAQPALVGRVPRVAVDVTSFPPGFKVMCNSKRTSWFSAIGARHVSEGDAVLLRVPLAVFFNLVTPGTKRDFFAETRQAWMISAVFAGFRGQAWGQV
jgi:hypothetical protein